MSLQPGGVREILVDILGQEIPQRVLSLFKLGEGFKPGRDALLRSLQKRFLSLNLLLLLQLPCSLVLFHPLHVQANALQLLEPLLGASDLLFKAQDVIRVRRQPTHQRLLALLDLTEALNSVGVQKVELKRHVFGDLEDLLLAVDLDRYTER